MVRRKLENKNIRKILKNGDSYAAVMPHKAPQLAFELVLNNKI